MSDLSPTSAHPPAAAPAAGLFAPAGVRLRADGAGLDVAWDPVPGAAAYVVEVLDAAGAPLQPQPPVEMLPGGGARLAAPGPGGVGVRVRAVSAFSPAAVLPPAPAAPRTELRGERLHLAWDAVPGAEGYEVRVEDAPGAPLDPPPPAAVAGTAAVVATEGIARAAAARVRAISAQGAGPWSAAAPFHLDASRPRSAALGALLERLRAAGAELALSPERVGSAAVSRVLALLPGAGERGPVLRGAVVEADRESVHVEGEADLLGRAAPLSVRFTAGPDGAVRAAASAELGELELGALYDAGLLPAPAAPVAGPPLDLPHATLSLDSAAGEVRLAALPSAAGWDALGLPGTALGAGRADVRLRAREGGPADVWATAATTLRVEGGPTLDVELGIPHGVRGWTLRLAHAGPVELHGLEALAPLLAGAGASLPQALRRGPLLLERLEAAWSPALPHTWDLLLGVRANPEGEDEGEADDDPAWTLDDGSVTLEHPSAVVAVRIRPAPGGVTAFASAVLSGIADVSGRPARVTVELPSPGGGYVLRAVPARAAGPDLAPAPAPAPASESVPSPGPVAPPATLPESEVVPDGALVPAAEAPSAGAAVPAAEAPAAPASVPEAVAEAVPEPVPEDVAEAFPERVSETVPEAVPEAVPETSASTEVTGPAADLPASDAVPDPEPVPGDDDDADESEGEEREEAPDAPDAPEGLRLDDAEGGVQAAWSPVAGADRYEVEVTDREGRLLEPAPTVELRGIQARIGGVPNGLTLRVRVRAWEGAVPGPWSAPAATVVTLPAAPAPAPLPGETEEDAVG